MQDAWLHQSVKRCTMPISFVVLRRHHRVVVRTLNSSSKIFGLMMKREFASEELQQQFVVEHDHHLRRWTT